MALDKQRILDGLGSVMNQLQSADCGCMGKLFSNSDGTGEAATAMGSPLPTCGGCRRGCCHGHGYGYGHGYSAPCAGEPVSATNAHTMNQPCMGHCNPPKLYADTYNYLSDNLMQPVVKEVYNDLKSITPANTVMNNPMASQMGLSQQGNMGSPTIQGNMGMMTENQMARTGMGNQNIMHEMGHMQSNMPMNNRNQQMKQIAGMGPQIVNMMMGDGSSKPSDSPRQGGQLTGPMMIDAPQSPHGKVGVTPLVTPGEANQYTGMPNMGQGNMSSQMQPPTAQYMAHQNMYAGTYPNAQNQMTGNMIQANTKPAPQQMSSMHANPAAQQMAATSYRPHGQHTPGIAKFNEMFPGAMQGLGGDLGFDPMAIAIQMNPANHQNAAMDAMQKIMNGNGTNKVLDTAANAAAMQPVIAGTNAAVASISQSSPMSMPVHQTQQNSPRTDQRMIPVQHGMAPTDQFTPFQQQGGNLSAGAVPTQSNQASQQIYNANQVPQQQVYTALTGARIMNQQQSPQQMQMQQLQQHQIQNQQPSQQIIDPNTGAVIMPGDLNTQMQPQPRPAYMTSQSAAMTGQQVIKDPIFPADTSKNQTYMKQQKYYEYNTLGQPIEMMPATIYQTPESNLPQTLSPQPIPTRVRNDQTRFNVKSTVSKTSIMGNRPVERAPSRSQLQQIYNQYKGSQSYTQQNIREPGQGTTYSEGNLNVAQGNVNQQRHVPVERVGGDTAANNQAMNNQIENNFEHVMGQIGDVPVDNNLQGDVAPVKAAPMKQSRCRNGLQDMVYTAYPPSAAWSFHGQTRAPFSAGYRFCKRP